MSRRCDAESCSRGWSWTTALGMMALLVACDGGPSILTPEPCPSEQVTVTASTSPQVDFSWAPTCPMAWLEVFHADSTVPAWIVTGQGSNIILPVVRYGKRPEGTLEIVEARSLQRGVRYDVRVYRWIGGPGGPGSIFPAGSAVFVP